MVGNVYQITTVPAKIDIATQRAKLSASMIKPKLDIKTTNPSVDIHQKNIKLQVDSSACWAEEGHKTARMLMADYARQGLESVQEYIHQTAVEGQEMVHAGPKQDVIKEKAKSQLKGNVAMTGIKFIPSQRPVLTWEENDLQIEYHPLKYNFNWSTTTWANINLEQKGSVTVFLAQKPEFHVQYIGSTDTLYLFHSMDKTV